MVEFSKKTGDYVTLSKTDIKVLALTYTLEKELHGNTDHLRHEPLDKPMPATEQPSLNFFDPIQNKPSVTDQQDNASEVGTFENDDDGGWITLDNITQYTEAYNELNGAVEPGEQVKVACLTTDFAMQNVLLQMRMNLLSIDGMVIKKTQKWILMCYTCNKLCKQIEKLFCPDCGYPTLEKVSYTLDEEGNPSYNIPRGKRSLRGTKYPLPIPKGGRNNNDLILYEQQIPRQRLKKKEISLADHDLQFLHDRSSQQRFVVGHGRKNPNESRKKIWKEEQKQTTKNITNLPSGK